MPSTGTKPARDETMSKLEVIEYLGKSKRTVETFVSRNRLGVSYVAGPNGKTARFRRSEVEALKHEIDTPTFRAVPDMRDAALQAVPSHLRDMVESRAAVRQAMSPDPLALLTAAIARIAPAAAPVWKPWLTLQEAVDYSGLTASFIVQAARTAKIRAVGRGEGRRFHRDGLAK